MRFGAQNRPGRPRAPEPYNTIGIWRLLEADFQKSAIWAPKVLLEQKSAFWVPKRCPKGCQNRQKGEVLWRRFGSNSDPKTCLKSHPRQSQKQRFRVEWCTGVQGDLQNSVKNPFKQRYNFDGFWMCFGPVLGAQILQKRVPKLLQKSIEFYDFDENEKIIANTFY